MPLQYLASLLTPAGRISQAPFALVCVLLAFVNLWVYAQARKVGAPRDLWMAVLLMLIWSKFCIMSRRMHDTGKSGIILIPVLVAALLAFLLSYDQHVAGAFKSAHDRLALYADHGVKVVRALFIAVFVYLIRAPSDEGPNAYGAEWDDVAEEKREAKAARPPARRFLKARVAPAAAGAAPDPSPDFSTPSRASRKALARLSRLGEQALHHGGGPEPAGMVLKPRRLERLGLAPRGFGRRG